MASKNFAIVLNNQVTHVVPIYPNTTMDLIRRFAISYLNGKRLDPSEYSIYLYSDATTPIQLQHNLVGVWDTITQGYILLQKDQRQPGNFKPTMLTGILEIDTNILMDMPDAELLPFCVKNRGLCDDENFWHNMALRKLGVTVTDGKDLGTWTVIEGKNHGTWKDFYYQIVPALNNEHGIYGAYLYFKRMVRDVNNGHNMMIIFNRLIIDHVYGRMKEISPALARERNVNNLKDYELRQAAVEMFDDFNADDPFNPEDSDFYEMDYEAPNEWYEDFLNAKYDNK